MATKTNLKLVQSNFTPPKVPPFDYEGEAHQLIIEFTNICNLKDREQRLSDFAELRVKAFDYTYSSKISTNQINKTELLEISQIIGSITTQNNISTAGLIKKLSKLNKSLMGMTLYDLIRVYAAHQVTSTNFMEV